MRAAIALGSNLDDRLAILKSARQLVEQLPQAQPPILASAIYETEPVDCKLGTPNFFNAVLEIGYDGEAGELMQELRTIEASLGRTRRHERNESRTVDLDLLYFGDAVISTPDLRLPHPRIAERRFVLEPLHDIRPNLTLPGARENVGILLRDLPTTPAVVRVTSQW